MTIEQAIARLAGLRDSGARDVGVGLVVVDSAYMSDRLGRLSGFVEPLTLDALKARLCDMDNDGPDGRQRLRSEVADDVCRILADSRLTFYEAVDGSCRRLSAGIPPTGG